MSLILPLKGDKIKTVDDEIFNVISYTGMKEESAVYVKTDKSKTSYIYFRDIAQINNVDVELVKGSGVFKGLGNIKRTQHIPQIHDIIDIEDKSNKNHEIIPVVVTHLKLKNKSNMGLLTCEQSTCFKISEIFNIERADGGKFDKKQFMKIYKDYLSF